MKLNIEMNEIDYGFFIAVEYFFLGEEIEAVVQFDGGVAVGRQRQWEIPEGVKGHAAVPADGALQRRFQLAHEQVHDPRIVPPQVAPPRFRRFLTVTCFDQKQISIN